MNIILPEKKILSVSVAAYNSGATLRETLSSFVSDPDVQEAIDQARKELDIYLRQGAYPLVEDHFGSVHECETVLSWLHKERPGAIYVVIILSDGREALLLGDGAIIGGWFKAGHHVYGSVKEEYVAMVAEEARRWS